MSKNSVLLLLFMAIIFIFSSEIWSDNGRAGYTGAPGETTCTNCHNSYALNSGGGSINVHSSMNSFQYEPGQTYDIEVAVARSGNYLFGLGFEALDQSNANAGTLIINDAAHTQIKSKIINSVSRKNVVHTLNGGSSLDSMVFNFQWTAPTSNIGEITFYYSGVAANGANNEAGDYVYNSHLVVSPISTTSIGTISEKTKVLSVQNPVTDQLHINYCLGQSGRVVIDMFSMEGKLIKTLFRADRSPGLNTEHLTGLSEYPKGIYLLRTLLNNNMYSQKIVLD